MTDHQRDAGAARGSDDLAPLLDGGGDRFFDQDVNVARDAGERDLVVQVGRRRDGYGIDAFGDQLVKGLKRATAGMLDGPGAVFGQGIDDPDQRDIRQTAQDARVVGSHHTRADNADSHSIPLFGHRKHFQTLANPGSPPEPAPVVSARLAGRSQHVKTRFAALGYQRGDWRGFIHWRD